MPLWNPLDHTNYENLKWCWLRAVEWANWPLFLSVPIAPILLLKTGAWQLIGAFVALDVLWLPVRYHIASIRLSAMGALYGTTRWLTIPVAVVLLGMTGRWLSAAVALLWPVVVGMIGGLTRPRIGRIQVELMRELGYAPAVANPLSSS